MGGVFTQPGPKPEVSREHLHLPNPPLTAVSSSETKTRPPGEVNWGGRMLTRAMAIRVVLAKLGCAVGGERAGHHPGRRGEWPAYAGTYASKNDTFGVILDSCRGCKH